MSEAVRLLMVVLLRKMASLLALQAPLDTQDPAHAKPVACMLTPTQQVIMPVVKLTSAVFHLASPPDQPSFQSQAWGILYDSHKGQCLYTPFPMSLKNCITAPKSSGHLTLGC